MSVFNQIKQIFEHQAGVRAEDIKLESSLANDFGLDDLDTVEIVMQIEQSFGITIPDEEKLLTIGDFVNYVTKHKKGT